MNHEQILKACKDEVAKSEYGVNDFSELDVWDECVCLHKAALLAMQKVAELLTDKKEA